MGLLVVLDGTIIYGDPKELQNLRMVNVLNEMRRVMADVDRLTLAIQDLRDSLTAEITAIEDVLDNPTPDISAAVDALAAMKATVDAETAKIVAANQP